MAETTLNSLADLPDTLGRSPAADAADGPDPKASADFDAAFDAAEAEDGNAGADEELEIAPEADPKPETGKKPVKKAEAAKETPADKGKAGDAKPTTPEPKVETPPEPAKPDPEGADPEVDKIRLQKGAHPKTQEGFKALGKVAKERGAEIKRLQAEVQDRETKLAEAAKVAPVSEEERKELEELRTRDFIQNPEKSRRITQEFDAKLTAATDTLLPLLTKHGLPTTRAEAGTVTVDGKAIPGLSAEALKEAGGIGAMPYAWWEANVLNNPKIDGRTRATAARLVNEFFDVQENRAAAIEKAGADRKGEEARLAKEAEKQGEDFWKGVREELDTRQKAGPDFLRKREYPAGATKAQKDEVDAHNARYGEIEKEVIASISEITPKRLGELGIKVAERVFYKSEADRLNAELEAARKELADHKAELSKIKTSSQISRARSAVPIGSARRGPATFDDAFDAAEAAVGR